MNITSIRVRDIDNRWESLPLALQAVARWAGVELHFRSLNAALGLSFAITAPMNRGLSLSWWMTLARDAFLEDTAERFGIRLQRLELPDNVTPGTLEHTAWFDEHARPRVGAALEHNKPVIAWRGWPDYHAHLWGIIVDFDSGPVGFRGSTMWAHGALLPLTTPPRRLFIVEAAEPQAPDPDVLLRFALRNIRTMMHNDLPVSYAAVTGLAAYERWLEWLSETGGAHDQGDRSHNSHYQMARFVTHNRESAVRFIEHYKDGFHDDIRPYLEAMHADCKGTIQALSTSLDLRAVEVLYRSPDGRDALSAGVHASKDFLAAQIRTVDHLADKLGV